MPEPRPPLVPLVGMGVLTIVAFGAWFYGFGVLIEPIRADTGWSESTLTSTYGASLLLTGIGATVGGRIIDRVGGRWLFAASGIGAGVSLWVTSTATSPLAFALFGTVAGSLVGAAGYYHATQAVIARIAPASRTKGITALTLFGALASPVFLPLMGWLVTTYGWRPTMRVVAVAVGAGFALAAATTPHMEPDPDADHVGFVDALRRMIARPVMRSFMLAGFAAGIGSSLLLLYQVPAMVDAGLALTTASTLAGVRGFMQLAGRLPLPRVVDAIGSNVALRGSFVLTAAGALLLPAAGTIVTALVFTVVAGVAIGALAALEGIYAAEITDPAVLGVTLGTFSLLRGLGSALGPVVGGPIVDVTGSRTWPLLLAAVAAVAAAVVLPSSSRDAEASSGAPAPSSRPAGT